MAEWEKIIPKVNESAEFLEIASDFGDPLELFREALHNAYDQGATEFKIIITVSEIRGQDKLVIELLDNGTGMSRDTIINHFWNLRDSKSRGNQFPNRQLREFKVFCKHQQTLDRDVPELLCSGHPFPKENYNISKLFDTYGEIAADYYVKKYVYAEQSLETMPIIEVKTNV